MFDESVENQLLPVDNWAMFSEKGGVKGGMSLMPIDEIQTAIQTLIECRAKIMEDLD